ncbi:MAG: flagellar basal body L-ring protein FlgH [Gammaproteobacteria bacterium]|jgi:flagellar L-ring protein FlgH|nr:flagellar basal body L-ring protein FlgH [Gammaproteobacteria bacterium]
MKLAIVSTTLRVTLAALLLASLAACEAPPRRDPEFAVTYPAAHASPAPAQSATGAIFQAGYDVQLFEDLKARRVGDILTIRLSESNQAAKSNDNAVNKSGSTEIANPTILGAKPAFALPGVLPLAAVANNTLETDLAATNDFAGKASAKQSNSLNGNITVTIADVLPNGNLLVRGEKRLNLNQGNEYIKISGIVRPVDIATDNTVPSTKVADATIIYSGDGANADSSKVGWLQRFFISAMSPF